MRNFYFMMLISILSAFGANGQNCTTISIDSFNTSSNCGAEFVFGDPVNSIRQLECTGVTGAITGAADLWFEKLSAGSASIGYTGTGAFGFNASASSIAKYSITYDGIDGNTDPESPNITGPVLGDFSDKTIQFVAVSIDDMGPGKYITFIFNAWDSHGKKSTASLTINGPAGQTTNQNYNLGMLTGLADLTDIRAVQFVQESNQNGMDNEIASLAAVCPNQVLPVTLRDFSGKCAENHFELAWTTTSEVNADYFEIEESADASHFEKIGVVFANGAERNTTHYSFTSPGGESGTVYFRLKMIDKDQSFSYSRIISVKGEKPPVLVYPTVFTNYLTIDRQTPESKAVVSILDLEGKIKCRFEVSGKTTCITSSELLKLERGVYILQIASGSSVETRKILKE